MLDDNLDPTSLLKEIRDDKIATIIIDANASVSYMILKKVHIKTLLSEPPKIPCCHSDWPQYRPGPVGGNIYCFIAL